MVQGVFTNFCASRASCPARATASPAPAKKPTLAEAGKTKARAERWCRSVRLRGRVAICSAFVGLGANLFTTGVVHLQEPPVVLMPAELHSLSALLLQGKLSAKRTRFEGSVSRPAWRRLPAAERRAAAQALAVNLERQGIHHAQVYAYKTRAIEVEFGGVVYVDDAK